MTHPSPILDETKTVLNAKLKKPKSQSQCIMEIKEIKQVVSESFWELDQRFKMLLGQANFQIHEEQHKEWFIASLLPHIKLTLTKQNISTQVEALEISMKLEASPVADTQVGVQHIQSQVAAMHLKLQDLKKGNEI